MRWILLAFASAMALSYAVGADTTAKPKDNIIVIGKIDSGVETFDVPGSLRVTVESVKVE
jgi:hypothetical protein